MCENHLFRLKEKREKDVDLKSPLLDERSEVDKIVTRKRGLNCDPLKIKLVT